VFFEPPAGNSRGFTILWAGASGALQSWFFRQRGPAGANVGQRVPTWASGCQRGPAGASGARISRLQLTK
jgi:hypothetical protein